jgi:hypothetical protein
MPAGAVLIQSVSAILSTEPLSSKQVHFMLVGSYSSRAVRYALKKLVELGQAERKYPSGPTKLVKYIKKEIVNE